PTNSCRCETLKQPSTSFPTPNSSYVTRRVTSAASPPPTRSSSFSDHTSEPKIPARKFVSSKVRTKTIDSLLTNLRPGYAPRSPDRLLRGRRDRTGASACRGHSYRWPVRGHQHRLLVIVRCSRRRGPRGRDVGGPRRVRRGRGQRRAEGRRVPA